VSGDDSLWGIDLPTAWPDAPQLMSVSTANEIEACPRRWLLGNAAYPNLWSKRGYPPRANVKTLGGTAIHYALEILTKAFMRAGCAELASEEATTLLRELGGFSRILELAIARVIAELEDNPRARSLIESAHRALRTQLPKLRASTQALFGRIQLRSRPGTNWRPSGNERRPLAGGSYAELEVRDTRIGWKGKIDLFLLTDSDCEIIDFKTGLRDPEHPDQVQTYAVLWQRDQELNPTGRAATRMTLSYVDGEADVPVPSDGEIALLAERLNARQRLLVQAIASAPGTARPSGENCRYCSVRQLCMDYWNTSDLETEPGSTFCDLDVRITGQHGPRSWDVVMERSPHTRLTGVAVLREGADQPLLRVGLNLRILGAHFAKPEEEGDPTVIQLVSTSELFERPPPTSPKRTRERQP